MNHLEIRLTTLGKYALTIFALAFLTLNQVSAQNAQFQFFSNAEDITCHLINGFHQDKDGFIWVLGEKSNRYDGYNFVSANGNESELPYFSSKVNFIITSKGIVRKSDEYFYVQTLDNWQVDSFSFKITLPKHAYFLGKFVHESANGDLLFPYVDSLSNQFNCLKLKDRKLVKHWAAAAQPEILDYTFIQVLSDHEGCIFITDHEQRQLIKYNLEGKLINRIAYPKTKEPVYKFKIGRTGTMLLYAQNELFELDKESQKFELHPLSEVTADKFLIHDLTVDKDDNIWVFGEDRNLLFYDKKDGRTHNYYKDLSELIPRRVDLNGGMLDRTGIVWIKTLLGVIKVVLQDELFETYFDQKMTECNGFCSFRGITEGDEGEIYASYYNGLFKINREKNRGEKPFPHHLHTPKDLDWKDGRLMLNNGEIFDPNSASIDTTVKPLLFYPMDLGQIEVDASGNYWNAQDGMVYRFNEAKNPPDWEVGFEMPQTLHINDFYYGRKSHKFWIGHLSRLFVYDLKEKKYTIQKDFQEVEQVLKIYEDNDESLWLGTDSGLIHYNLETEETQHYTTFEGLSNNYVCGILPEGDSCLWLSTNEGLSRLSKKNGKFINFYEEDGLTNNEFNRSSSYRAKDGQLFFGGVQGINAFYPKEVLGAYQYRQDIGKIMLTAFLRTDEKEGVVLSDLLNLNRKELECFPENKSITFEFSLSDYRHNSKNKYSYFLDGYEDKWSEPSKYNFARYPNLPPGDYTFRVKALDAKGHWNPNELSVPVKVYPPWWQTNLAYSIYFLFTIALMYLGYRLLRYRLALQHQFKFEQNEARRLKELDTFKSRLFTNITHEFRTPLTVILGMTEELQNGFEDIEVKQKEQFSQQTSLIQRNGQSLLRLVNQLLDLSKLQHKAFKLNLQNNSCVAFINYVTSSFQSYANQQNVLLTFRSDLSELYMDFDPALLQQVMTNLLSNAIKFTPSGGEILVDLKQSVDNQLLIEVRDNGIGIPVSKLENIFDIFYQVDGSATRPGEGTGIGLAHTKELVELAGGRITVKSEEGKGSTFLVQLPIRNQLKKSKDGTTQIFSEVPLEERAIIQNGNLEIVESNTIQTDRPHLLLIEDNPDVLTYLKTCFQDKYQIEIALNGRSGIEKAMAVIPDLIISDVMMPEKNGFEVCDHLKNEETTSHIPIVLLTAKADFDSKLSGLKKGADAYFSKPFRKEELLLRVEKLLEKQIQMARYFKNKFQQSDSLPDEASLDEEQLKTESVFLQKVNTVLESNYADKDFTLPHLCKKLSLSRSQLFRKLKALTGESPSVYIKNFRLQKAKLLLETTELNVSEVAWKTGFGSLAHFSRSFQQSFGVAPSGTSKQL